MLDKVKLALRRTDTAFDTEIQLLIDACLDELSGLGIYDGSWMQDDPQIVITVIAYCKWRFGENDVADRWEKIYYDMITKLQCRNGYGLKGEGGCNG